MTREAWRRFAGVQVQDATDFCSFGGHQHIEQIWIDVEDGTLLGYLGCY